MDFEILHPKHGLVATDRAFGTITFATLDPDFIFSCQFRDRISEEVRRVSGPVAVVDRQTLEMVVIIDSFNFNFDSDGNLEVSISIAECSSLVKENVKYTMFLFSEYEYEVDMYQGEILKDDIPESNDVPYVSFIDIVSSPIGSIVLKRVEESEMAFEEVRVFPSISVSQSINLITPVIIAESPDSEFRILVDFGRPGISEVANKCRAAFGENMSDQIAILIVTLISSYLDNMLEINKEYKIFQAVYVN